MMLNLFRWMDQHAVKDIVFILVDEVQYFTVTLG